MKTLTYKLCALFKNKIRSPTKIQYGILQCFKYGESDIADVLVKLSD